MMIDIVTPEVRSRMMSRIRSKDTKPELAIRSALHRLGFRFRLHRADLPGKPDLVFPKYRAVILIHGCFWHGHGCHLFKWPRTRAVYWKRKIGSNVERDREQLVALTGAGWRVATIWECALKGRMRHPVDAIAERCERWLTSNENQLRISGDAVRTVA